jgi:dUTPase
MNFAIRRSTRLAAACEAPSAVPARSFAGRHGITVLNTPGTIDADDRGDLPAPQIVADLAGAGGHRENFATANRDDMTNFMVWRDFVTCFLPKDSRQFNCSD